MFGAAFANCSNSLYTYLLPLPDFLLFCHLDCMFSGLLFSGLLSLAEAGEVFLSCIDAESELFDRFLASERVKLSSLRWRSHSV